jgi:hypothetical protein
MAFLGADDETFIVICIYLQSKGNKNKQGCDKPFKTYHTHSGLLNTAFTKL